MFSLSPDHIARLLQSRLPGRESHLKMIPAGRDLPMSHSDMEKVRYSSVLLLLFRYEDQVFTSLIKRSTSIRTHPGQISLPGGRIETGESPEMTALREAHEEIGISPSDVRVLGRLSELVVPVSRYTIFPYVGWTDHKPEFVLNKDEVEKLLMFPVQKFQQDREVKYTILKTSSGTTNVPYYSCDSEIVWGATAMILTEFLDVIKNQEPRPIHIHDRASR